MTGGEGFAKLNPNSENLLGTKMGQKEPQKTPLYHAHEKLGAKIVDFHGWLMPIQYEGIVKEHQIVREKVGLFDVSHMGEFRISGPEAKAFLQKMLTNNLDKIQNGQCLYSPICYENGGIVDDSIAYKISDSEWLLVVNAGNIEKDFKWFEQNKTENCELVDESARTGLIALQGPLSEKVFQKLFSKDLSSIKYYHFIQTELDGVAVTVSRTGYTGEKGVEIFSQAENTVWLWETLMEAGKEFGIAPIGLGARDTLRLEVKFALYGNDLSEQVNPLEAGLGWTVDLNKEYFIGKEALVQAKEKGLDKRLVCFQLEEPGVARHGYKVWNETHAIGEVTSGTVSPTLNKSIGLAYVDLAHAKAGTSINIEVRNKKIRASVVKPPFVPNRTQ